MADLTFEGEVSQIGFDANAGACTASLRGAKGTIKSDYNGRQDAELAGNRDGKIPKGVHNLHRRRPPQRVA